MKVSYLHLNFSCSKKDFFILFPSVSISPERHVSLSSDWNILMFPCFRNQPASNLPKVGRELDVLRPDESMTAKISKPADKSEQTRKA